MKNSWRMKLREAHWWPFASPILAAFQREELEGRLKSEWKTGHWRWQVQLKNIVRDGRKEKWAKPAEEYLFFLKIVNNWAYLTTDTKEAMEKKLERQA